MSEQTVSPPTPLISLQGLSKSYRQGDQSSMVLHDLSFTLRAGETLAIMGGSGSGKSTLLNILGLLDFPDAGVYRLAGQDARAMNPGQLAHHRNRHIGFVFQSFNLLAHLSVLENVALPFTYRDIARGESSSQAARMLERVGLADRVNAYPADLSGGQRQRVAIARALVGRPGVILADEPTGNLDGDTANAIMDLLLSFNREFQTTLIVVTHDERMARRMGRRIHVRQGTMMEVE